MCCAKVMDSIQDDNGNSTVDFKTVCKTVRPMLSNRCPVCPVLSVTLLYYGQKVGWIKMLLGTEVGLGPGNIVFDGNPQLLQENWHSSPPHFRGLRTQAKLDRDTTWY